MNVQNKMMVNHPDGNGQQPKMTSLEIAEISGKSHADLLKSIRKQEVAWEKVNEGKFSLVEYRDQKGEIRPMYELDFFECMYVATKFNDESRAKVILRWKELEIKNQSKKTQLSQTASEYQENTVITVKLGNNVNQIYIVDGIIYAKGSPIIRYITNDYSSFSQYIKKIGKDNCIKVTFGKQQFWFINESGFTNFINSYRGDISFTDIATVYKDMYGVIKTRDEQNSYSYAMTDSEMLKIIEAINKRPFNRGKVLDLLLNFKIK